MQTRHDPHIPVLVSLSLAVVTLTVFWQVQGFEFLIWDDYAYIVDNPHVRSGLSMENVLWAFTTAHASYWHPLAWLSHMLDCELYGLNPLGHHFNTLLIHLASTLILFHVLRKMTGALWQSAFVAAIFVIHPLRIESVAWVTERKDVLSVFFWMTTLWAYLRFTERKDASSYILTVLSFTLGLMAKPTLVTLPFILLLLDYWPLGRSRFGLHGAIHPPHSAGGIQSPALIFLEKTPLFLLAAGSSLVTFLAVNTAGGINAEAVPLGLRLQNAAISYVKYMGKMFWPADLAFLYPHSLEPPSLWLVAGAVLFLGCLSVLVFVHAVRHPYLLVGWLWYLGTLIPVIGLVQVGTQTMADRFTYVPQVGITIATAWGVSDLLSRGSGRNLFLAVISGLILCFLALSTHSQLRYWKDSISLFSHALQVTDRNFMAHHLLGLALSREGRTPEAMSHFSEALKINPIYVPSLYNLAFAKATEGKLTEAVETYSAALRINPKDVTIHNNLGNVLARMGQRDEAVRHFMEALKIDPRYAPAHNNLANVLVEQGRRQEAVRHYTEALRVQPDFAKARHNLERVLRKGDEEKGKGPDETDPSR
ncbi:MAG: tetratricopeptide repeat protein [Thermodesulfobacteriota bacterium]